jgi:hypothetical protein
MLDSKKCAHHPCDCRARKSSSYCSAECEVAMADAAPDCSCGHKACVSAKLGSEAARDAGIDLDESM